MDVNPPSTLRRLGIALAGLAVAALTGAACVLSFDDLRSLAVRGEARPDLAYLYPAAFDALLFVALISVLLVRSARALVRAQAALVLVLLIVAAAAVNVLTALRHEFPLSPTAVGVAVAPWVMLAVALWLWLLLIKHVQARRSSSTGDDSTDPHDIVPFDGGVPAPAPDGHEETPPPLDRPSSDTVPPPRRPVTLPLESTPVVGPTAAPETPPLPERVTDPAHGSADPDRASDTEPEASPAEQEPAPETGRDPEEDHRPGSGHQAEPAPEVEPQPELRRPVRWGDRVKPADVLVHPRQSSAADKDADTQPVAVVDDARETPQAAPEGQAEPPDLYHGAEAADDHERVDAPAAELRDESMEDTAPHPVLPGPGRGRAAQEAPSGRLRSTPLPPED